MNRQQVSKQYAKAEAALVCQIQPHVHRQCARMFSARLSEEAVSDKVTFRQSHSHLL